MRDTVGIRERRLRRINWPLVLGSLLILIVAFLAVAGPSLAPRDPLEVHWVIQVDGQWIQRPFPAFTPGYPLGSDGAGRDLLSWLLWGVRPTLVMVIVVASVRLALGMTIGLAAGWSMGRVGRMLDALVSAALSMPVLIAAILVLTAFGAERGLAPFIIALSATGWVDTAQLVREQTRIVRQQVYVEAARALGESGAQIVVRHVRRHVMPMMWMLLAFEIGGTLLVTAGLGFLGYYVGGDFLSQAGDAASRRFAGMPELGQMLYTSWVLFDEPWTIMAAGTIIYIAVLGFNLLGEGMRQQLGVSVARRSRIYAATLGRVGQWIEERVMLPASERTRRMVRAGSLAALLLIIIGLAVTWWRSQPGATTEATPVAAGATIAPVETTPAPKVEEVLKVPGGHWWAAERRDPWGTLWTPARGPQSPGVEWVFEDESGFVSGPAVAADGTVYIASRGGTLYALDSEAAVLWQSTLITTPVGAPALDAAGDVYVTDRSGGLSALSQDGHLLWQFQPGDGGLALSGPIVGPDGVIYYPLAGGSVQAVSPDGESVWKTQVIEGRAASLSQPQLSPAGDLLFLREGAVDAKDGSPRRFEALEEFGWLTTRREEIEYVVGADGRNYALAIVTTVGVLAEWRMTVSDAEIIDDPAWYLIATSRGNIPTTVGVTPDRIVWSHYGRDRWPTQVVWQDARGQLLGDVQIPQRPSRLIAIDRDAVAYVCAERSGAGPRCSAVAHTSEEPLWELILAKGKTVGGGALAPGRIYVALREGYLYAIGEGRN